MADYDVVICGGGLAGLTLARQLRLYLPEVTVAVVERTPRPLPEAAHKVGESSVEGGSYYLGKALQLEEYFDRRQLPKFGLRYFLGDGHRRLEDRPETGAALPAPTPSYQIDRGRLENDLREMIVEAGVTLIEDHCVHDVVLADDDGPHEVLIRPRRSRETESLSARWVVDATSRRRLLQNKLNLTRDNGHAASAAWWRLDGRVDIADLVPRENKAWHRRVVGQRYLSTNHFMGRGYWVWFIPLSTGHTSIGIVTDESIHPFGSYGKTHDLAMTWLKRHEPVIAEFLDGREPLDFRGLKNYSYDSQQVFSHRRWSCVGEAGVFLDPFYSPGTDFIAAGNTITTAMIRLDFAGKLTADAVDVYNQFFLQSLCRGWLPVYRGTYATFGHCHVFNAKHILDGAAYWSLSAQATFQHLLERPETVELLLPLAERYNALVERMQRLFIDWASRVPPREPVDFVDVGLVPILQMLHCDLHTSRDDLLSLRAMQENLNLLEELAQVIFRRAVEECFPDRLKELPEWVNAWAIGLDVEKWDADRLFHPASEPRDVRYLAANIRYILEPPTRLQALRLGLAARVTRAFRGRLVTAIVNGYIRFFLRGRSGLSVRRWFFRRLFPRPLKSERKVPSSQPSVRLADHTEFQSNA